MRYLVNVVYLFAILAASPWLLWAAWTRGKYRRGWSQKLLGRVPAVPSDASTVWLHAVSVGEVMILTTLVPAIRARWPEARLVITSTTTTGLDLARQHFPDCVVSFAPLDFSWAISTALRRLSPRTIVLVELELWPNLLRLARRAGVDVVIVNGRLSEASFRGYLRVRPLVQRWLADLQAIGVQNATYGERFLALGAAPSQIVKTGSIKFDGAEHDRDNSKTQHLQSLLGLNRDRRVFLAGSTQDPEESLAVAAFTSLQDDYPQLVLLLVPRHKERFDAVAQHLDQQGVSWLRRSQLAGQQVDSMHRIVLVDTIGELGAWWGAADIAFVGGSMGSRGGQNMIEPAAYGAAVCYGPNTKNFRDVTELMRDHQAAVVVHDLEGLTEFVRRCLDEPEYAQSLGERASHLVGQQTGALERTLEMLVPYME